MFDKEWWKLPLQIAMGLLLTEVIRAVVLFVLRAISSGRLSG